MKKVIMMLLMTVAMTMTAHAAGKLIRRRDQFRSQLHSDDAGRQFPFATEECARPAMRERPARFAPKIGI